MSFRVVFCLFRPNRQLYLKNKRERPARKTGSFAEAGLRGKVRGLVLGFLGDAERSGQLAARHQPRELVGEAQGNGRAAGAEPARVQLSLGPGSEAMPWNKASHKHFVNHIGQGQTNSFLEEEGRRRAGALRPRWFN